MKTSIQKTIFFLSCCFVSWGFSNQDYVFFSEPLRNTHLAEYTDTEKQLIEKDLKIVESVCIPPHKLLKKPIYFATAGAPGARKSTILERFLQRNGLLPYVAYLDPDQRAMRYMAHTYQSLSINALKLAEDEYETVQKNAYHKWRDGSNYITLTLLEKALQNKMNIAHGTTLTGSHISMFLPKLKQIGYDIVLLLCCLEDEERAKAIQYRVQKQGLYQSTPEDALKKGRFFPMRMKHYFKNADTIYIYWSDRFQKPERLAAILDEGKMVVRDEEALECVADKYEHDREMLREEEKLELLPWNECIEQYTSRFTD